MLKELYSILPQKAILRYSGVTGYGEKLIQTALNVDLNEIETIAHYTAAKTFEPNVTSIVDIGGQDMKYIKMKNGSIDNIGKFLGELDEKGEPHGILTSIFDEFSDISDFKECRNEIKNKIIELKKYGYAR